MEPFRQVHILVDYFVNFQFIILIIEISIAKYVLNNSYITHFIKRQSQKMINSFLCDDNSNNISNSVIHSNAPRCPKFYVQS